MAVLFGSKRGDKVPNAFTFTDVTGATPSTLYESNAITVTGIDAASPMTIVGGEYQKNGAGAWSSAATTIKKNQTVKVRRTSSGLADTAVNVTLTIGGISDTYTITTAAELPGGGDPAPWILATGFWNDDGVWDDNAFWRD